MNNSVLEDAKKKLAEVDSQLRERIINKIRSDFESFFKEKKFEIEHTETNVKAIYTALKMSCKCTANISKKHEQGNIRNALVVLPLELNLKDNTKKYKAVAGFPPLKTASSCLGVEGKIDGPSLIQAKIEKHKGVLESWSDDTNPAIQYGIAEQGTDYEYYLIDNKSFNSFKAALEHVYNREKREPLCTVKTNLRS